jgi:hypothetical protein
MRVPRLSASVSRGRRLLRAAQAGLAGLYAWALTVVPRITTETSTFALRACAATGAGSLLALLVLDAMSLQSAHSLRPARWARPLCLWGFVATSGAVWTLAQDDASTWKAPRWLGMLAWAMFALSFAGPPTNDVSEEGTFPIERSQRITGGHLSGMLVVAAVSLAIALQCIEVRVETVEQGLLARVSTLAASLLTIGIASTLLGARSTRRK